MASLGPNSCLMKTVSSDENRHVSMPLVAIDVASEPIADVVSTQQNTFSSNIEHVTCHNSERNDSNPSILKRRNYNKFTVLLSRFHVSGEVFMHGRTDSDASSAKICDSVLKFLGYQSHDFNSAPALHGGFASRLHHQLTSLKSRKHCDLLHMDKAEVDMPDFGIDMSDLINFSTKQKCFDVFMFMHKTDGGYGPQNMWMLFRDATDDDDNPLIRSHLCLANQFKTLGWGSQFYDSFSCPSKDCEEEQPHATFCARPFSISLDATGYLVISQQFVYKTLRITQICKMVIGISDEILLELLQQLPAQFPKPRNAFKKKRSVIIKQSKKLIKWFRKSRYTKKVSLESTKESGDRVHTRVSVEDFDCSHYPFTLEFAVSLYFRNLESPLILAPNTLQLRDAVVRVIPTLQSYLCVEVAEVVDDSD